MPVPTLVIHGGAGLVRARCFSAHDEAEFLAALQRALATGQAVLDRDGAAIDAVQAAVEDMEDAEPFNAGRGSVFSGAGEIEMDASIMDSEGRAGAVAGVQRVRHPIAGARAVLDDGQHVMLIGAGAEAFCEAQGVELVDAAWFHTDLRWRQLQDAKAADRVTLDHDDVDKYGTVGAVALDARGRLAAATSTGGMTNKRPGRVGDAPLIGAGTYVDARVAISCTGHGEHFMRAVAAHAVAARVALVGESLGEAALKVLDPMRDRGGRGGLIGVHANGEIALPFNTAGMFRGSVRRGEAPSVAIWA